MIKFWFNGTSENQKTELGKQIKQFHSSEFISNSFLSLPTSYF